MKLIVMDMQKGITVDALYNYDHFIENTVTSRRPEKIKSK